MWNGRQVLTSSLAWAPAALVSAGQGSSQKARSKGVQCTRKPRSQLPQNASGFHSDRRTLFQYKRPLFRPDPDNGASRGRSHGYLDDAVVVFFGSFKFFHRRNSTRYLSLSVFSSETLFSRTRITTSVPVSLFSPTRRSKVSPTFT